MFNVGDRVWFEPKKCWATVDFIEDDHYAEVKLGNGVLVETTVKSLSLKSPQMLAEEEVNEGKAVIEIACDVIMRWIEKNRYMLYLQASGMCLAARMNIEMLGGEAAPWEKLTATQKLHFLAIVTNKKAEDIIVGYADGNINEIFPNPFS